MPIFPINRGGGVELSPPSLFAGFHPFFRLSFSRSGRFLTGLFFCAFFAGGLAVSPVASFAENPPAATKSKTQIITDDDKGTITFIIDGKAVAQINKDGLHIVESINYGGTLTDSGSAYVEKIIKAGGEDADQ